MAISPEALIAFLGVAAGVVTAVVVLFRWVEDQDNAKHEQLRQEISNEIRAEIYRNLLELNVKWLSSSSENRETIKSLAGDFDNKPQENQ